MILWGRNVDEAASVRITGNGMDAVVPIRSGPAFVVGTSFRYDASADVLDEFTLVFADESGNVITTFRGDE
ncbi:MAG: hypothetical protein R2695_03905 [Acidimicrobiales bacterium]